MAGLSSSEDEQRDGGRGAGIALWATLLVLAIGATAVLVLSDDARMLRLAVVGALWAALIGAFAAARYRRAVAQRRESTDELRNIYELELEREVAARREYELEVEADTRRRLEDEVRDEVKDDLAALRGELRSMRENLEALLGGEVLVERVALRAESTRMRSLPEPSSRMLAAGEDHRRGVVAGSINSALSPSRPAAGKAANGKVPAEAQTELISAVARKEQRVEAGRREVLRTDRRSESSRSEPARPDRNRREPAEQRPHGPTVVRREPAKPEPQPERPVAVSMAASRSASAASIAAASRGAVRREPASTGRAAESDWMGTSWDLDERGAARAAEERAPAGRRSARPTADQSSASLPAPGGGRRHSSETSAWEGGANWEPEPPSAPSTPEPEAAGAHASGRSVSELLAAHGGGESPTRRRRRRAE